MVSPATSKNEEPGTDDGDNDDTKILSRRNEQKQPQGQRCNVTFNDNVNVRVIDAMHHYNDEETISMDGEKDGVVANRSIRDEIKAIKFQKEMKEALWFTSNELRTIKVRDQELIQNLKFLKGKTVEQVFGHSVRGLESSVVGMTGTSRLRDCFKYKSSAVASTLWSQLWDGDSQGGGESSLSPATEDSSSTRAVRLKHKTSGRIETLWVNEEELHSHKQKLKKENKKRRKSLKLVRQYQKQNQDAIEHAIRLATSDRTYVDRHVYNDCHDSNNVITTIDNDIDNPSNKKSSSKTLNLMRRRSSYLTKRRSYDNIYDYSTATATTTSNSETNTHHDPNNEDSTTTATTITTATATTSEEKKRNSFNGKRRLFASLRSLSFRRGSSSSDILTTNNNDGDNDECRDDSMIERPIMNVEMVLTPGRNEDDQTTTTTTIRG